MLITLNGIYPFTSNQVQVYNGTELMLNWLNDTLNANPNMRFMTQVHVFFGRNYYQGEQIFWYTELTDSLMKIIQPFQQNHVLSIGAHIHHINVVSPYSHSTPDAAIV